MSESGFSGLPPGPRIGEQGIPSGRSGVRAKIVEAHGELREVRKPTRLHGPVVRQNRDGTIRVRTEKGDLVLQLRGQDVPAEGDDVEIEIPAGAPPRTATLRQSAVPRTAETTQSAPPQVAGQKQAVARQPAADTARERDPAVLIEVRSKSPGPAELAARGHPLQPDQLVRLEPLPPGKTILTVPPAADLALPAAAAHAREVLIAPAPDTAPAPAPATATETLLAAPDKAKATTQSTAQTLTPGATTQDPSALQGRNPPATPVAETAQAAPSTAQAQPSATQLVPAPEPGTQQQSRTGPAPQGNALSSEATPMLEQAVSGTARPDDALAQPPQGVAFSLPPQAGQPIAQQSGTPATLPPLPPVPGKFDALIQRITLPDQGPTEPVISAPPLLSASIASAPGHGSGQSAPIQNQGKHITTETAPPPAPAITAQIAGFSAEGRMVLSLVPSGAMTPALYIMQSDAAPLPAGTTLHLQLQPAASPALFQPLLTSAQDLAGFFSQFPWPALQDIYQTLAHTAPQLAQALAHTTPNPASGAAQITPAALFFIAAMRAGDMQGWLGDKVLDILRRAGREDSIARLERDSGLLARSSAEPVTQDWRALALPMFWEGDIQKMMLYYRHHRQNQDEADEDGKSARDTRFIFDLDLSRMGGVQLDGLHRPGRLDLVIRTKEHLSAGMQQAMRRLYIDALEQTDLAGELSFQYKPEHWVRIDMPARHHVSVI